MPLKTSFLLVICALVMSFSAQTAAAQDSPDSVVSQFLDAWGRLDYPAMYALLSNQSKTLIQQPAFEARYQQVTETLGLTGVTHTLQETHLQGLSAAVKYDVSLQSSLFATIEDPGRTIRLVLSGGQWGVAWSSMDIFDVMAGDASLRAVPQSRQRAPIYDRNGLPLMEESAIVPIYGQQQAMLSVTDCITLLGDILRESILTLRQRFANQNIDTIFFMGTMTVDDYALHLEELRVTCGLQEAYSAATPLRVYYGGNAMWHTVGYIGQIPEAQVANYESRGYSSGDLVGLGGVELAYENDLSSDPERVLRIIEPGGTTLRELAGASGSPAIPVTLTIDRRLQVIVAQAMSDAYNYAADSWGAESVSSGGAAVVLDVNTGAILALVSYPLVDPNLFNPQATAIENRGNVLLQLQGDRRRPLFNHATQDAYSPGSTYKIITHIATLNEGMTTPDQIFSCPLEWDGRLYGDTLEQRTDWRFQDGMEASGDILPAQALMASCNPFYWRYGAEMWSQRGPDVLNTYARLLGLGQVYGLNSAGLGEAAGNLITPGSASEAMNNATGQGNMQVPPIQMAVAVAAIANGGTVYRPYLVQQVGGLDGTPATFTAQPQVANTLTLNPGVLDNVREGMCGVTSNPDLGTAYGRFNYNVDGDYEFNWNPAAAFTICAKTGTAEASPYPHAWFVSFTPAEDPQFAIVVMVTNTLEGSQVAAPITRRILDEYYNVPQENYALYPDWWNLEPYTPLPNVGEAGGSQ